MLERYRELVDDWAAFEAASVRPLHRVVWANPLRGDVEATGAELLRLCPEAVPLGWHPNAWRLPTDARPGNWSAYKKGRVHGQEEAALWAVGALDVAPGQRVLDLCASPGNKTAQIAVAMADRGMVIANERTAGRMAALRFNLERLGVTSAVVTRGDGVRFDGYGLEGETGLDRVLVDAPCTCEGTSRKTGVMGRRGAEELRFSLAQIQIALLRNAVRLVKPGGLVVYATCTYAPEENEAVVDAVRDVIEVEPIALPEGLRGTPGLQSWGDRTYRSDMTNAVRIWPHHNDTGGFFVARLRRV